MSLILLAFYKVANYHYNIILNNYILWNWPNNNWYKIEGVIMLFKFRRFSLLFISSFYFFNVHTINYQLTFLENELCGLEQELSKKPIKSITYKLKNVLIRLIKTSIFDFPADALVNAANEKCLGGGGIDGQFVSRGGQSLANAREKIPEIDVETGDQSRGTGVRCPEGEARITRAGELKYPDPLNPKIKIPFKYVLHAVGPSCAGSRMTQQEKDALAMTYVNTLRRAEAFSKNPKNKSYIEFTYVDLSDLKGLYQIKSISFPTISTGLFGCITEESAEPVVNTVVKYIEDTPAANLKIQEINFTFFDPGNPDKADEDFNHYRNALGKIPQVTKVSTEYQSQ